MSAPSAKYCREQIEKIKQALPNAQFKKPLEDRLELWRLKLAVAEGQTTLK